MGDGTLDGVCRLMPALYNCIAGVSLLSQHLSDRDNLISGPDSDKR